MLLDSGRHGRVLRVSSGANLRVLLPVLGATLISFAPIVVEDVVLLAGITHGLWHCPSNLHDNLMG